MTTTTQYYYLLFVNSLNLIEQPINELYVRSMILTGHKHQRLAQTKGYPVENP